MEFRRLVRVSCERLASTAVLARLIGSAVFDFELHGISTKISGLLVLLLENS
jgi:hypothetical protein